MENPDMWRIPLLLAPAALAMLWIRRREALAGGTRFRELTAGQKAWILLQALPPGPSARLMAHLPSSGLGWYLSEGARLEGSGQNLLAGVLREFCAALPGSLTQGAGRDPEQATSCVVHLVGSHGAELAERLVGLWPPPVQPAEVDPAEPSEESVGHPEESPVPATRGAEPAGIQAGGLPPEAEQGP